MKRSEWTAIMASLFESRWITRSKGFIPAALLALLAVAIWQIVVVAADVPAEAAPAKLTSVRIRRTAGSSHAVGDRLDSGGIHRRRPGHWLRHRTGKLPNRHQVDVRGHRVVIPGRNRVFSPDWLDRESHITLARSPVGRGLGVLLTEVVYKSGDGWLVSE